MISLSGSKEIKSDVCPVERGADGNWYLNGFCTAQVFNPNGKDGDHETIS
jgi:hypothetical protein